MHQRHQDALLDRHLKTYLGELEPEALDLLRERLEWVEAPGGHTLMTQGEPGDAMYIVLSGRLRVYVNDDGAQRMVRELGRGQIFGEMSLYTGAPRAATVVTIRDSVLVRLAKAEFMRLLAASPQLSIVLTRQIIEHLQAGQERATIARPVTIAMVRVTDRVDAPAIARRRAASLAMIGPTRVVDATTVERDLGEPGIAHRDDADVDANRRIALHVDELEATHEFVLLVGDDAPTAWTRRCCRSSDEILLLADASAPVALHEIETQFLMQRPGRSEAAEVLVLLHAPDLRCPRGTRAWLARRPVTDHIHVRPEVDADLARLARILSHTAVGLVLAGGGARGLAHLGIFRALRERGIEIDYVGGTSIGSIMAALIASDRPLPEATRIARKGFSGNPTGDLSFLPLLSLIKGQRLRGIVTRAVVELLGFDADVEDLWKNYFCVASNYSQASEMVIRHGKLSRAMRASAAIPGALPPVVHDGDLLCDGGTFNNFPVDAMLRMRGVGSVIGVDLHARTPRRIELDEVPSSWALLRDRWRPRAKRRYRFPSLVAYLMNVTILYSTSRQQQARKLTDLYFNPPLDRVGLLEWHKFDDIVKQGHAHAVTVLDGLAPEEIRRLVARSA